mgnify:CR=1 FL=1
MQALAAEREKCNDAEKRNLPGASRADGKGAVRPKEGSGAQVQKEATTCPVSNGAGGQTVSATAADGRSRENDRAHLSTKVGAGARQPGPNRCAETAY